MTKVTVEQAVAAIQAVTTRDAIKAVLEQCTKAQLHEVFLAVTNNKDELEAKSLTKGELVGSYSARIVAHKAREAFKKMDAEAKAEYLISGKYEADYNQLNVLLHQSSLYELLVIAVKFGADFEQFTAEYQLHRHYSNVFRELFTSVLTLDSARRTAEWEAKREALKAAAEKQEVPAVIETPTSEPITKNIQSETAGISVELKETEVEVPAIDSYEIGKRIVSLKGNAKAQQAVVQECGEEFLLNMYFVFHFAAPIRITMETPDELREYLCRDVIRVARDAEYARYLLNDAQIFISKDNPNKNVKYLEGWVKFLADYAAPEKVLTVEEQLANLRQCIHNVCGKRAFFRHQLRIFTGTEFEERYAENVERYTARGLELLKQYKELKASMNKPAVVEHVEAVETTKEESEMTNTTIEQSAVGTYVISPEIRARAKAEQAKKERAKANRFFRTMSNQQIAFALALYRRAMEWASTQDFSMYSHVTTRLQVEEWVRSPEAQEADGQYSGWIYYIDHYSRMLNVKMKGHSGFDEPTNCDEEDSLVQSITDRIALIGADPRAVECEKAYHEELEEARQAAKRAAEKYIQGSNGGIVEFTDALIEEIMRTSSCYENEVVIKKAIAAHNCEVLSRCTSREALKDLLMQVLPRTITYTYYLLTDRSMWEGRGKEKLVSRFVDWFTTTEYYQEGGSSVIGVQSGQAQSAVDEVETDPLTVIEPAITELRSQRNELKAKLHEMWQIRHAVIAVQGKCEVSPKDYEALGNLWEDRLKVEADSLLREYKYICQSLKEAIINDTLSRVA